MVLLTPTTFKINFCGQREGTSPRTSITVASCQRALTAKAGGTIVCAWYIHVRMRTVFQHDGDSENRKTGGAVARRAWTGITRRSSLQNTVRRVACFKAIAPPVANFVMAYVVVRDHGTENGLPPFTRLPRKRKISEIIDRRSH